MPLRARLAELVAFDTQNPSGDERALVDSLTHQLQALGAAHVESEQVEGHAFTYACFGARPRVLLNAHVDTVPANAGYSAPPHRLVARDGRLYGLGTADTKGAVAAILEALEMVRGRGLAPDGVAVLFSGDEEKRGTCMRRFLSDRKRTEGLERAVVCEPTGCAVGTRHRGVGAAEAGVTSPGGHSSLADSVPNPLALLARAAVALDDWGHDERSRGPAGFQGLCLNIAGFDGGLAFNVIPTRATLRLSLRPAPGADTGAALARAEGIARAAVAPVPVEWSLLTSNPSFHTRDAAAFLPLLGESARQPVDLGFWTEAALLSAAGIDAVVFGPGRVEQAHAADEFVAESELETACQTFVGLLSRLAGAAASQP